MTLQVVARYSILALASEDAFNCRYSIAYYNNYTFISRHFVSVIKHFKQSSEFVKVI